MDLHPTGERPSERGPADSFPGTVWLSAETLMSVNTPAINTLV